MHFDLCSRQSTLNEYVFPSRINHVGPLRTLSGSEWGPFPPASIYRGITWDPKLLYALYSVMDVDPIWTPCGYAGQIDSSSESLTLQHLWAVRVHRLCAFD